VSGRAAATGGLAAIVSAFIVWYELGKGIASAPLATFSGILLGVLLCLVLVVITRGSEFPYLLLRVEEGVEPPPLGRASDDPPELSLYTSRRNDGQLITLRPVGEGDPHALRSFVETRLEKAAVERILSEAERRGLPRLIGDRRDGNSLSGLRVVFVDGFRYTIGAEWPPTSSGTSLADEMATSVLPELRRRLLDLSWLPKGSVRVQKPYKPERFQLRVLPYKRFAGEPVVPERVWPLPDFRLAEFGRPAGSDRRVRCGVLSDLLDSGVVRVIVGASPATPWRSGATLHRLALRPLLPDESGCYHGGET